MQLEYVDRLYEQNSSAQYNIEQSTDLASMFCIISKERNLIYQSLLMKLYATLGAAWLHRSAHLLLRYLHTVVQEKHKDMTESQRQIFWDHLRVLDSERKHFHKPPAGWKPKPVRDMDEEELHSYWAAFQTIVSTAAARLPETEEPMRDWLWSDSDTGDTELKELSLDSRPNTDQGTTAKPSGSNPLQKNANSDARVGRSAEKQVPLLRCRRKTTPSQLEDQVMKKIQSFKDTVDSKKRRRGGDEPSPKKRKYKQKNAVEREGKKPCVPIMTKVKLFKESW